MHKILTEKLEKRFFLSFSLLLLVGVGSTMFHMTLQYAMQLMDEIPMVWSTCAFIYTLYMTTSKPGDRGGLAFLVLFVYSSLFTLIYARWQHPLIHQVYRCIYPYIVMV